MTSFFIWEIWTGLSVGRVWLNIGLLLSKADYSSESVISYSNPNVHLTRVRWFCPVKINQILHGELDLQIHELGTAVYGHFFASVFSLDIFSHGQRFALNFKKNNSIYLAGRIKTTLQVENRLTNLSRFFQVPSERYSTKNSNQSSQKRVYLFTDYSYRNFISDKQSTMLHNNQDFYSRFNYCILLFLA